MSILFRTKIQFRLLFAIVVSLMGGCNLPELNRIVMDASVTIFLTRIANLDSSSENADGSEDAGSDTAISLVFSPSPGYYNSPQMISLTSNRDGSQIFYTLDGSTPTSSSELYSNPIHIWRIAGASIQAIAISSGETSEIFSARYQYPPFRTGQDSCFDDTTNSGCPVTGFENQDFDVQYGVVKDFTGPTTDPTYPSDYITIDNTTGLVWKLCEQGLTGIDCSGGASDGQVFATASNGCNALNSINAGAGYAGRTDWRLPSIHELYSIIDYRTEPHIDVNYFPGLYPFGTRYHASTPAFGGTGHWRYEVTGGLGWELHSAFTSSFYRCVAGNPQQYVYSFTDNGDGTINDNKTGLIWQKCSRGQAALDCSGAASATTWELALTYCNGLTLAGRTWRLPTSKELETLVDWYATASPLIDATNFPNTFFQANRGYWTSTTHGSFPTYGHRQFFGTENSLRRSNGKSIATFDRVRCVANP